MKVRHRTAILFSIAVTCFAWIPFAAAQSLTDHSVEDAAKPLLENRTVDGLSIGYIEGDRSGIVHLGRANQSGEKPNGQTVYELGSISKLFTSLLLADATLRGEVNIYTAANVPNAARIRLPSRDGRSIKWIDLSTHRSGLPRLPTNLSPADPGNPYRDYDSKKAAEFLNSYKLPRTPGKAQEYSNLGVSVLGYLLAQKIGKPYQQLLRERIAMPLKMTDCTVALSSDQTKRLATPHAQFGSPTSPWTFADMPGAGEVHATIRDMMSFAKAQLDPPDGTIGEAIELGWKQQTEADESGPAMGLAWMIAGDGQTRWHNGQTGGFTSAIFINRKQKCAIVILCNTSATGKADELAMQLLMKAAGGEAKGESTAASDPNADKLPIDAKLRSRLAGRYQLAPDFIFTVSDRDGHLMVAITHQPTQEVFPDSPTQWSYRAVKATLEFKLPKTGSATSLILHQNGVEQTARRMD
ncbi:MAG TPA: serine hydrolase [Tepidisphaeraceae bacterium]|nr:serine hydrolase [Tepidisphaeraceae bacterium]